MAYIDIFKIRSFIGSQKDLLVKAAEPNNFVTLYKSYVQGNT